jgi:hypothetical protein
MTNTDLLKQTLEKLKRMPHKYEEGYTKPEMDTFIDRNPHIDEYWFWKSIIGRDGELVNLEPVMYLDDVIIAIESGIEKRNLKQEILEYGLNRKQRGAPPKIPYNLIPKDKISNTSTDYQVHYSVGGKNG